MEPAAGMLHSIAAALTLDIPEFVADMEAEARDSTNMLIQTGFVKNVAELDEEIAGLNIAIKNATQMVSKLNNQRCNVTFARIAAKRLVELDVFFSEEKAINGYEKKN